ncbi:hypothetical protein LBMAG43_00420 [Methylococcaceae bacterium]|nr:hypothetical protein LBMAG43_00420 [Methylococcaceae bacterium]
MNQKQSVIYEKIINSSIKIKDVCNVFNGVKPFEKGKGNPPQSAEVMKTKPFVAEGKKPSEEWSPLLRGRLIQRYINL